MHTCALQVSTLSCLVQRGVDVTTKDNDGLKPADLARENNHEEAYELLFRVMKPKLLVWLLDNSLLTLRDRHLNALLNTFDTIDIADT